MVDIDQEEEFLSEEEIAQSMAVGVIQDMFRVYFDKDTGDILAITNEPHATFLNFFETGLLRINDFLTGKLNFVNYKVVFTSPQDHKIVPKISSDDIEKNIIIEVPEVDHWSSTITIENFVEKKFWGFQLNPGDSFFIQQKNINTTLEFYIVHSSDLNYLIRTIKINLRELAYRKHMLIEHVNGIESDSSKVKILTKRFFEKYGYRILYDTKI